MALGVVTTHPQGKGNQIGVNVEGQAVGYAARIFGYEDRWTAYVYIPEAPFDTVRTGFTSAKAATDFIALNGTPRAAGF